MSVCYASETQNTAPSNEKSKALVHEILIEEQGAFTMDDVGKLTADDVPLIRSYLTHQDRRVRYGAVSLLAHIPSEATAAILDALTSDDPESVLAGLNKIGCAYRDARIIKAWAVAVSRPSRGGFASGSLVRELLRRLNGDELDAAVSELIPNILANMPEYNTSSARGMTVILGRYGEPGDRAILDALKGMESHSAGATIESDGTRARLQLNDSDLQIAILYAKANLGSLYALKRFRKELREGTPEAKQAHLKYLELFRPTAPVLRMGIGCLDDRTAITMCGPSEDTPSWAPQLRVCEYAVDALREWFGEVPVESGLCKIHSESEIDQVRRFALKTLAELEE